MWVSAFKEILARKGVETKNCKFSEIPEKDTDDPQTTVRLDVKNLIFANIPTIIAKVRFSLVLDGNKKSSWYAKNVTTNKDIPQASFTDEFTLFEKRLDDCCREFDKFRKRQKRQE